MRIPPSMFFLIYPHIICRKDCALKVRGFVGIADPASADGEIQDDIHVVVERSRK